MGNSYKEIKVWWLDPYSYDEWHQVKEYNHGKNKPKIVKTLGFLVFEDDEVMIVALNDGGDGDISQSIVIPLEVVVDWKFI